MTCPHENKITTMEGFIVCSDCGEELVSLSLRENPGRMSDVHDDAGIFPLNIIGTQPSMELARDDKERRLARRLNRTQVHAFTNKKTVKHVMKARNMIMTMMSRLEHDKVPMDKMMRAYEREFAKGRFKHKKMGLSIGSFVLHELKKNGRVGDVEGFVRDAGLDVDIKSFKRYCWKHYQVRDTSIDVFSRTCRDLGVSEGFMADGLVILGEWRTLHAKALTKAMAAIHVMNERLREIGDFSMRELELDDVIGTSTVRHFLKRVGK